MYTPGQMFEGSLTVTKGAFANGAALDKELPIDVGQTAANFVPGRCVSISSNNKFVIGAFTHAMPFFLLNGATSSDVANSGVSPYVQPGASGPNTYWTAIEPAGNMTAIPAKASVELQTTEFDTSQNYLANDLLKTTATGVLTNVGTMLYTSNIVGCVSVDPATLSTKQTNNYNLQVLNFYPTYLPGTASS